MANFDCHVNHYSVPFLHAVENFDVFPPLCLTPTAGAAYVQTFDNWAEHWDTIEQPAGPSNNILVPNDYGYVAPATSYPAQTNGLVQPYSYWSEVPVHPQPEDLSDWEACFENAAAVETPVVLPASIDNPFAHWGNDQSGPVVGTDYPQDVGNTYQTSTGVTRTGLNQTSRFQPYGPRCSRSSKQVNAEAGPSTPTPSSVPSVGPPIKQSSGGKPSETEKNKVSKSKGTKASRDKRRKHREHFKRDSPRLLQWVQRREGLSERPVFRDALAIVLGVIPTIRQVVHQKPCLLVGETEETEEVQEPSGDAEKDRKRKRAKAEQEKRNAERRLYQELSRYYPRTKGVWTRPQLLLEVLRDLETHPDLQQTPDQSTPGASTSTREVPEL